MAAFKRYSELVIKMYIVSSAIVFLYELIIDQYRTFHVTDHFDN